MTGDKFKVTGINPICLVDNEMKIIISIKNLKMSLANNNIVVPGGSSDKIPSYETIASMQTQ